MSRVKALILRHARDVNDVSRAIETRDADETIVHLRLVTVLDFASDGTLSHFSDARDHRVSDLLGAARLGLAQVVCEKMPEIEIHDRSEQDEDAGQQARIPGHQSK